MDPVALYERLAADDRQYMMRWLALELLLTDDEVCADRELYDKFSALQERWEQAARERHGIKS